ncbi:LLM class flavin-dependent oxidoreductase [Aquisalinus flavus]|uniref:Luciferase-like monooxygenase n=1 Tax=Aquisalinus flavus TaxID=1526572 RepID=A0A8J2V1Y5_9PROT|nr:LLM class flavin-dependent oxidoreductase [Aquisalinus flavus]MBD0426636.1 LLM class flavin-dependent oxidoreductase [Aquisalinus flavus]UNE47820.1 LLM class flavin-dependent oxidoreductase [Aquisalinus flavus]GGD06291.1 alkane 1-monooxygenase [Aquisalinus flavus]
MIPLSILDLAPITEGGTIAQSFESTVALAQAAERLGYTRFWLAEHHNIGGIASAATSVLIGHVAGKTSTIRVGAGGIMLPNHAPLIIAEQFGTLETLYPGRIDLGLGRAPGGDHTTARALRRTMQGGEDRFPQDVDELLTYFSAPETSRQVRAIPGEGLDVPVWILGSSLYGAQMAAHFGLPYAFASHFAPQALLQAVRVYRDSFRPSPYLDAPKVMMAANAIAAATDEEADFLFTSLQQAFANLRLGKAGPLPAPRRGLDFPPQITAGIEQALAYSAVGGPERVGEQLRSFIARVEPDEIILASSIHDPAARLRSLEIVMDVMKG